MQKIRRWLMRRDERAETQRAMVVLICTWLGGGLSAMLAVWGFVTREWVTLFQGVALLVLAMAVMMRNGGGSS